MVLILFLMAMSSSSAQNGITSSASSLPVDNRHIILIDDLYISNTSGITREHHQARKYEGNPIIEPDKPWETYNCLLYGSVLHENNKFRMYYTTYNQYDQPAKSNTICYAESSDGLNWIKPALGSIEYKGSKQNNIIFRALPPEITGNTGRASAECQGITVIHDNVTRDPDPTRRYKGLFCQVINGGYGLFPCFSGDGVNWVRLEKPVFVGKNAECMNLLDDPTYPGYLLYHKLITDPGANPGRIDTWRRSRVLTTSKDFMNWTEDKIFMKADAKDAPNSHIYESTGFAYGNMYLGFIRLYHSKEMTYRGKKDQFFVNEIQLIYSYDAIKWERIKERDSFIIPVGGEQDWDSGNNSVSGNAPIRMGNELWIYYGGRKAPKAQRYLQEPTSFIGLAKLRLDGFVSLNAGREKGVILTRPLDFRGQNLFVNAAVKGSFEVELIGSDGKPVEGYRRNDCIRVQDDQDRVQIRWHKSANLPSTSDFYQLKFYMQDCKLYSFWAE